MILVSSVAAVSAGYPPRAAPFTENDWTDPSKSVNAYQKSKTLAERAAWDWVKEAGNKPELVTLLLGMTLGPVLTKEAKTSMLSIKKLMDGSVPGFPTYYVSVVDIRDVSSSSCRDPSILQDSCTMPLFE